MRITPDEIIRLRGRHRGYWLTLATEVALLLLLPVAQAQIWLLAVLLILLALVLMVFVSRYSTLRKTRPLIYGLGGLAIALEVDLAPVTQPLASGGAGAHHPPRARLAGFSVA